ncbi:hypothetical protein JMN32_18870 [Fulvivirga sp. 29W222]|uniref:Uncharacterized protein n=1 Tax=Fulvivirga marina TaxID=2494733 RepID=A0A937KDE6_9BACT|nr:AAA family ATPase [Fulvivirga marina]MBL6448384.1 hypothetical protein [Fulvivirga marina]
MSGFKLLAIRPLKGCHPDYHKVLVPGEIYQFYQDYKFEMDGSEVSEIKHTSTVPENLYDVGDLKVSISAIVGKNGSGKSTITELLYYLLRLRFIIRLTEKSLSIHSLTF